MTNVSVSDFRNNLTNYLRLVKYKDEVLRIVDEKINEVMAEVIPVKEQISNLDFVRSMFGIFRNVNDKNRKALRNADLKLMKARFTV